MNLELLMGRGTASPHLNPHFGLVNLFARVSLWALQPQRHDPMDKMGVRLGSVLPDGPASVLQAVVTSYPVLTQHLLHCSPSCVTNNNSFNSPRCVGDAEGLIGRPEGGRLKMSEPKVCSCRHKR